MASLSVGVARLCCSLGRRRRLYVGMVLLSLAGCDGGPTPDDIAARLPPADEPTTSVALVPGVLGPKDFFPDASGSEATFVEPGELLEITGTFHLADDATAAPSRVLIRIHSSRRGIDVTATETSSDEVRPLGGGVYAFRGELRAPADRGRYLADVIDVAASPRRIITTGTLDVNK